MAPQEYKTAGTFMLVSGIFTVLVSFTLIAVFLVACVGVFWIATLIIGIFEIVVGASALSGNFKPSIKTVSILGLIGAVLCGNLVGFVLEILVLVFLGKPEVNEFLDSKSGIKRPIAQD